MSSDTSSSLELQTKDRINNGKAELQTVSIQNELEVNKF